MLKASDDFPRPGNAGENDEGLARNFKVNVLQVVLARAAHPDKPRRGSRFHPAPFPRNRETQTGDVDIRVSIANMKYGRLA